MAEVLVLVEHADGALKKVTTELITAARVLGEPSAVVVGAPGTAAGLTDGLKAAGAAKIYVAESDDIDGYLVTPKVGVLAELAGLDESAFRVRFAGTPVKRTGRDRFLRNVLIAIGNSGEPGLAAAAEANLSDPSPLVRGMAVWALGRLVPPGRLRDLFNARGFGETDDAVRAEWRLALDSDGPETTGPVAA